MAGRTPTYEHVLRSPTATMLVDGRGTVVDANDAFARLMETPRDRLIGQPLATFVAHRFTGAADRAWAELTSGGSASLEVELALRAGSGRDVDGVLTAWRLNDALDQDTTFAVQMQCTPEGAQGESRRRESALRLALDAGQMGIWHWDFDSNESYLSPELLRLHGREHEPTRFTLDRYLELVHPDDREQVRRSVIGGIDNGAGHDIEYRILLPGGEVRWLQGKGRTDNAQGARRFLSGVCIDITDRKQSEEELRQRDERHRAFLATSTEAIWRFELEEPIDPSWPVDHQIAAVFAHAYLAECNDAMARMYGYERASDLAGTRLSQMMIEADPVNQEYLRRFIASGYRLTGQESHELDRFGRKRFFRNSLVGILEQGRVVRAWGTQTDITEQKLIEAQLRESEARFRLMADHAPVLIWLADTDNRGTFFNRPWLEFTGQPLETQLGAGWIEAIHPDDRAAAGAHCQRHFDQRLPFRMEFRLRRHDGVYRWVLDHGTPLIGDDGEFGGYIGACVDVTEMKIAREREAFLADAGKVLASSLDYRETLARVANLAVPFLADWCAVDMFTDGDTIERLAVAHHDPERLAAVLETSKRWPPRLDESGGGYREVLLSRQPLLARDITDEQLAATARDPEHLAFLRALGLKSVIIAPFVARDRVLGALSLIYADSGRAYEQEDVDLAGELASRAALAIDNARLYEEAQAASRAKDDFLARLSHELRTPLNAVLGWAQLLRVANDPAQRERGLTVVERNGQALARIIEDLLDFSRNVRGSLRLEVAPIDLCDVVREAATSVEPIAARKEVTLRLDLAPPANLSGDPARLQQVVWNLLTNALKFTPAGGQVSVSTRRDGAGAELIVRDTGEGIREDVLEAIFDPFRQGVVNSTGGLGLGLAIVRQIVEAHGGTVQAQSAGTGTGATIVVRLPVQPPVTAPSSPSEASRDR